MSELNVAILSTVFGTLIATAILAFNTYIWQRRHRIKVKVLGYYERLFGQPSEAKYTVGAAEYIQRFRAWQDPTKEGLSLVIPYARVELVYDNVVSVRVFRGTAPLEGRGNVLLIEFRDGTVPKSKHILGLTDSEINKVARRIYFQSIVGSSHAADTGRGTQGD